jgi:hypothetical protein
MLRTWQPLAETSMARRALTFAALIPLVLGFSDTQPLVAWSSHRYFPADIGQFPQAKLSRRSNILDLLPSQLTTSALSVSLLDTILHHDDICDHDAIVLVEQPGVSADDTYCSSN